MQITTAVVLHRSVLLVTVLGRIVFIRPDFTTTTRTRYYNNYDNIKLWL